MDKNRFLRLLTTTTITTILTLNIILAIAYGATANAYPIHPDVKVFGNIQKDWYVGHEWQKYVADDGLTYSLPFSRQDENITIPFYSIVFSVEFENKSIASASVSGNTAEFDVTKDYLVSNDLGYIYVKLTNKTSLATTTSYTVALSLSADKTITNDDYLFVTAKLKNSENLAIARARVRFHIKDEGANERILAICVTTATGSDIIESTTDTVTFVKKNAPTDTYLTVQVKIQDMLDKAGVNWKLAKLTSVEYCVELSTGDTLDSTTWVEAYFRHAFISPARIYIDDPSYEDGFIINGTSGQFTPSAGDVLQVYGANATKIVGVTIPFVYEDTRPIEERVTTIPQSYGFQYEWRFVMPKSPTETGDKFTYSNTNITLYCWFDGAYIKNLWVNGVDKTSVVSGKKTPTTTGLTDEERYWTYGLASSLVGGNQYDIELRVEDLPSDVWYALTQEPQKILTWSWLYDRILAFIQAILNILGFSVTSIELKRRELRVPKA